MHTRPTRSVRPLAWTVLLGLVGSVAVPGPAVGQPRPGHLFSVDAEVVGGSLGYAWGGRDGRYWGVAAGLGGSFLSRMLLAGRHFAEEGGPSYEARDGATDKQLFELIHVGVFRRWASGPKLSVDAGLRTSAMLHFDSTDDDPGLALFLGGYTSVMWGSERIKVGPRLLVGMFSEGSSTREFGIYLVPLTGRVSFGW